MSDHSELKRLADEFIAANDLFNESPQDNDVGDAWSVANDRFTEAASPEVILALIAENKRLTADCSSMRGSLKSYSVNTKKLVKDGSKASRERDQLRAEIAGLKTGYEAYEAQNAALRGEIEALRKSLDSLTEAREALIAQGRNFALDEASRVCFKTAFQKYYPAGTRYKLFTPKINKAVGDALVEAANLIADLPDGPYWRHAERQAKLSAMGKGEQS